MSVFFFFFFSSRRRHTRLQGDWSSDVCSSDLIGWIAAGLMPVRGWSGLLPVPGDGRYEWQGMLPPRELPQAYDPPGGMIVTANHNILPPGYPHALNYVWAPPYRAQRIDQVLRGATHLTVNDLERLQLDEYSAPASP